MSTLTFLVGAFSLGLSVIAIITMFILRYNIIEILNKDALVFDKNFEIKKSALEKAMAIVDQIEAGAPRATTNIEYINKMKSIYNQLICVVSNPSLAEQFLTITLDKVKVPQAMDFVEFKQNCRKDLGLKVKKVKLEK